METKVEIGTKWQQGPGAVVVKVVALSSDGEVGFRAAALPPKANASGQVAEWPEHWCSLAVFTKDRQQVVDAPPAPVAAVEVAPPAEEPTSVIPPPAPKGKRR